MHATPTKFSGIIPPLITPLTTDEQIDFDGLERLTDHVQAGGVHELFIHGTSGEGPSLSSALQKAVIARACAMTNTRVPVLAGGAHTSLDEAAAMSRHAAEHGCAAVVTSALKNELLAMNLLSRLQPVSA